MRIIVKGTARDGGPPIDPDLNFYIVENSKHAVTISFGAYQVAMQHTATHTATCCNMLRNTASHCTTIELQACRDYGVATIRRLLQNTGLICTITSLLQGSFAKETCDFKEPTNRSHPMFLLGHTRWHCDTMQYAATRCYTLQ